MESKLQTLNISNLEKLDYSLNYPSLELIKKYKNYKNRINEIKNSLESKELIINDDNLILLKDINIIDFNENDIKIEKLNLKKLIININNPYFEGLYFYNSTITNLDITSKCIRFINCEWMSLNKIKLHCNNLNEINCEGNVLKHVNFNKCKKISKINCSDNLIENIKINKCYKLKELNASENDIENITFDNLSIEIINLNENTIENINIINCPKIKVLNLEKNQIKVLTLSNMYFIKEINILKNPIRNINLNNVGNNMGYIDINYNKLQELDMLEPESNINIKVSSIFNMTKLCPNSKLLEPNKNNIKYLDNFKSYDEFKQFKDKLELII